MNKSIVKDTNINIISINNRDYICINSRINEIFGGVWFEAKWFDFI